MTRSGRPKAINANNFYKQLFSDIESRFGEFDDDTVTSIVGFSAGGPVSVAVVEEKSLFATCELALNPNQIPSAEGLNFELISCGTFDLYQSIEIFTIIGGLSLSCELGDGHTVEVSGAYDGTVRLSLACRSTIDDQAFGVYLVEPVRL